MLMKRTITHIICAAVLAFAAVASAAAQTSYFSYEGKRLANGATVTIEAVVTDPDWPDELECATNPVGAGMNGLLFNSAGTGKATLNISKNTMKPYRIQWCMGGTCQVVSGTSMTKDLKAGVIPVEYDATLDEDSKYGVMEATITAKVGSETVSVKVIFTYTDPTLAPVSTAAIQQPVVLEYFTLDGRSCKLQQPRGVSLARFSDGKVRKVTKK